MRTAAVRPVVHLICNAHLDPVWQWRWEEGASEAISTFRSAAEILNEHPGLIFCHNEAVLYRWVERLDPTLFREIRRLHRAGRWEIGGGWFLQPDCNLPGIESMVRQITEGRAYFREKFNAAPRVAYSFDAFGHGGGLPQLLRRAGYEMYIFMRPQEDERPLPSYLFRWRGVDGTVIPAYRISVGLYHTEYDNIGERVSAGVDLALKLGRDVPVFWGIGDHGGGATRADLAVIDECMAREKRVRIVHSTPDRFWKSVRGRAAAAPVVEGDLQRCFVGCYTSLSRVKREAAASLAGIVQAESQRAATWWLFNQKFPKEKFASIWRSHLFNDFHDILPGSCVEPAERDALALYGKAAAEARMLKLEAAAVWAGARRERAEIPLTVLNSNPALGRVPVEAEFMIEHRPKWKGTWSVRLEDSAGREIVCQEEQPEALLPFNGWRRKIVFLADLPGLGAAYYKIKPVETKTGENGGPKTVLDGNVHERDTSRPGRSDFALLEENPVVKINPGSGLLDSCRAGSVECLSAGIPRLMIAEDRGDSWGTGCRSFGDIAGIFEPSAPARVVEQGPVRTVVESEWTCFRSRIVLRTIAYASWPAAEIRLRVFWNEERKRLILGFPTAFAPKDVLGEIPGGAIRRPADGEIHVHGRWCAVEGAEGGTAALGIAHTGLHGIEVRNGEIRLSALRSSAYCHERGFALEPGRAYAFADQGVHDLRLAVLSGKSGEVRRLLPGLADYLAGPPAVYAHLPFGKSVFRGKSRAETTAEDGGPGNFLSISPANIRLLSCRPAADGKALCLRLQESSGIRTPAHVEISLPFSRRGASVCLKSVFRSFEIKTFRIEKSGRFRETDL